MDIELLPLPVMDKKESNVFIATPMYGGMCTGFYLQSMLQLSARFTASRMKAVFSFMFNESLIPRARNALTHQFLKTDCTHLMFIDADIKFNNEDIVKMLESDKEIICGVYPKKEINWFTVKQAIGNEVKDEQLKFYTGSFVINLVDYAGTTTVPVHEPFEIWNGGTGFMLIKREVLEKLKNVCPSYINDVVDLQNNLGPERITEFFATSIEPGTERLLSEDYHFCRTARINNIKVWGAPWAQLAHIGTYAFEGKLLPAP